MIFLPVVNVNPSASTYKTTPVVKQQYCSRSDTIKGSVREALRHLTMFLSKDVRIAISIHSQTGPKQWDDSYSFNNNAKRLG